MRNKYIRYAARLLAALMLLGTVLSASSCDTWDWLWSREAGDTLPQEDMILGDEIPEGDTDVIWEGAVDYTGEAHSGTDIYYVGKKGSPNRSRIIVIDPGHQLKGSAALEPNGPDSEIMKAEVTWGATGVYTGQTEYELNLAIALLLRDELIRRGYSVVMIRETNNVSISNMERAEIANKYEAAAYIRIHANSWTDDSMRGAMTICQSASNPYPTCAIHYERSHRLSRLVLDGFCDQTGIDKLNMREMDDMTGTNWSRVPTTIVEMGFLSNKSDDTLMATDYFRQEAAIGIANGLDTYFEWLETQLPEWETRPQKPAETTPENPPEDVTEEPTEDVTEAGTDGETTAETAAETATGSPTETAEDTPASVPDTTAEDTSAPDPAPDEDGAEDAPAQEETVEDAPSDGDAPSEDTASGEEPA
jgi:N-acetylmuramoyl-L-alanine amidase